MHVIPVEPRKDQPTWPLGWPYPGRPVTVAVQDAALLTATGLGEQVTAVVVGTMVVVVVAVVVVDTVPDTHTLPVQTEMVYVPAEGAAPAP